MRAEFPAGAAGVEDVARYLSETAATTVLIDGRSGAGKSTLAARLRRLWPDSDVVALDRVYPGWDGLAWAGAHVQSSLLRPRARGERGRWRSWNWVHQRPGVWHTVEPGRRLLVEGAGALTSGSRRLADLTIWVDADDADRERRAKLRDGDARPVPWELWAAQEDAFIRSHHPRRSADVLAVSVPDGFVVTANDAC